MRRNILLTLLLVLITTVGVRAEVVPIQKQSVGTHAVTTNQQETILQLQEENKKLKEQLERVENKVDVYWDVSKTKIDDVNDNQSQWLAILTIIVALISGGLGVVAPYFQNKEMQAKLEEATKQAEKATSQAEKAAAQVTTATEQIATASDQVQESKNQATAAKEYAENAGQALTAIEELKKQVDDIQTKINEDKTKAEDAAKAAKVSQLFAEAFNEKDSSRAIDLYTQLLALNPDNAEAYYNRGVVKSDLGDKSGALSDYDKSISLNPDDAEAYNNRGNVKSDLGDKSGALSDYDKSIELKRDSAEAYNNRALCYCKMAEEETDEEKKKEYIALAEADEKRYNELTGGKKK